MLQIGGSRGGAFHNILNNLLAQRQQNARNAANIFAANQRARIAAGTQERTNRDRMELQREQFDANLDQRDADRVAQEEAQRLARQDMLDRQAQTQANSDRLFDLNVQKQNFFEQQATEEKERRQEKETEKKQEKDNLLKRSNTIADLDNIQKLIGEAEADAQRIAIFGAGKDSPEYQQAIQKVALLRQQGGTAQDTLGRTNTLTPLADPTAVSNLEGEQAVLSGGAQGPLPADVSGHMNALEAAVQQSRNQSVAQELDPQIQGAITNNLIQRARASQSPEHLEKIYQRALDRGPIPKAFSDEVQNIRGGFAAAAKKAKEKQQAEQEELLLRAQLKIMTSKAIKAGANNDQAEGAYRMAVSTWKGLPQDQRTEEKLEQIFNKTLQLGGINMGAKSSLTNPNVSDVQKAETDAQLQKFKVANIDTLVDDAAKEASDKSSNPTETGLAKPLSAIGGNTFAPLRDYIREDVLGMPEVKSGMLTQAKRDQSGTHKTGPVFGAILKKLKSNAGANDSPKDIIEEAKDATYRFLKKEGYKIGKKDSFTPEGYNTELQKLRGRSSSESLDSMYQDELKKAKAAGHNPSDERIKRQALVNANHRFNQTYK